MKELLDLTLRWYDDSSLLTDDGRELVEVFLNSLGITSDVARDIMEVFFMAAGQDRSLTTREVKRAVIELRKVRAGGLKGLTDRNVQVWLKYFREIELLGLIGNRHHFTGNKKPSEAFERNTRKLALSSMDYTKRILEKIELKYRIK